MCGGGERSSLIIKDDEVAIYVIKLDSWKHLNESEGQRLLTISTLGITY